MERQMSDKNPRSIRRTVTVNKRRGRWGALLLVVGIVGIMVVLVAPKPPDFLFFYFGLAIFWGLVIVYRAFKVSATNSRADTSPRPHGSWLDRSSKTQRSEAEADTGSAERSRPHRWENFGMSSHRLSMQSMRAVCSALPGGYMHIRLRDGRSFWTRTKWVVIGAEAIR